MLHTHTCTVGSKAGQILKFLSIYAFENAIIFHSIDQYPPDLLWRLASNQLDQNLTSGDQLTPTWVHSGFQK